MKLVLTLMVLSAVVTAGSAICVAWTIMHQNQTHSTIQ